MILVIFAVIISLPVHADSGDFTRMSIGYVVYLPTVEQANSILAEQLTNGIVPEYNNSAIATADDSAAKLIVLAAAYKYTGDQKYLTGYTKLDNALIKINDTEKYIPAYFALDGSPLSVYNDLGAVRDARVLAGIVFGQKLPINIFAKHAVLVYGTLAKGNNSTTTAAIEYSANSTLLLHITFALVPGALAKNKLVANDIIVQKVTVTKDNQEITANPNSHVMNEIKSRLIPVAREEILQAIANKILTNPEFKEGFSSTTLPVGSKPLVKVGYQVSLIAQGKSTVPWNVVFQHKDLEALNFVSLTQKYSALQGAMYLPELAKEESTVTYRMASQQNIRYSTHSFPLAVKGNIITLTNMGTHPYVGYIWVDWRPVVLRRVHVAGNFVSFLQSKFGVNLTVNTPVVVYELPSGKYFIDVNRSKVFGYEQLEGTVNIRKPVYYEKNNIVQYPTLSLINSMKAYNQAIKDENPLELFVAVDNELIYMHGSGSNINSGTSGIVKAMYSLSDTDINKVSEGQPALRTTLYRWKRYYAQRSLDTAKSLVKKSLEKDKYSPALKALLWKLDTEANLTGLSSVQSLNDLYTGYTQYYGPDTKDYNNLAIMAGHLGGYNSIVQAINTGNYTRAQTLIDKLPANSTVRNIFQQKMNAVSVMQKKLKESAYRAVQNALTDEGTTTAAIEKLNKYLAVNKTDREATFVLSVEKAYSAGIVTQENAKRALTKISYFSGWKQTKIPIKQHTYINTTSRAHIPVIQEKQSHNTTVAGLLVIAILITVSAFVYRRKRKVPPRRR
ncbi:hypothetical protein IPdc08_00085 [archaeon]|nr:hypothetical protein IPdc08_00085 [archaeon]